MTIPQMAFAGPFAPGRRQGGSLPGSISAYETTVPISRRRERRYYAGRAAAIQDPKGEGRRAWSLAMLSPSRRKRRSPQPGRDRPVNPEKSDMNNLQLRPVIEAEIERLISLLDAMDGAPPSSSRAWALTP